MAFIKLTNALPGIESDLVYLEARSISGIEASSNNVYGNAIIGVGGSTKYFVRETVDEILAKTRKATAPYSGAFDELLEKIKRETAGQNIKVMPGPVQVISRHEDDVKRIALLESQIKAWKDAASVQLVEGSDEARIPCETPEQLIERLRTIYRWWSTAEQRAKAAEQDAINERESHSRESKYADGWCHRACVAEDEVRSLKTAVKAAEPLEPNRVIKTAHALITEAAKNPRTFHQKGYLFRLAKDAIEALYGGSTPNLEPYQTKGQL